MKIALLFISTFLMAQPGFTIITNTEDAYDGKIFIHSMPNYLSILDNNIEYYWVVNTDLNGGMDFKVNNSKLSYYYKPNLNLNEGFWIIADQTMQEIDTVQCTVGLTDYHDMVITDDNTYILQAYEDQIFDLSSIGGAELAIVSGVLRIQEFDLNKNLIFDWNASDHLNILDYQSTLFIGNSVPGQISWMHGNSIDVDYDDNLILSNRKSSEIIKINRNNGEVIWIMGGPLNEFQIINDSLNGTGKQHDVTRLDNGNILVFDNGENNTHPASRVVEYEIDENNKVASLVWEFFNPYGYISRAMGSAQRLPNGNTLINWGTVLVEGTNVGANIMEVDTDKNIVLEIQYDTYQSYKATKSNFEFNIPMGIGDTNLDNSLNIQDIIYIVNHILYYEGNPSIFDLYKIDSNLDHLINIIDIIEIVDRILSD